MGMDESHEGACTVAALLHFAAVAVENPVTEVGWGNPRNWHRGGADHQDLITTDTQAPIGEGLELCCGETNGLFSRVDDNEIVSGPMHFCEFELQVMSLQWMMKEENGVGRKIVPSSTAVFDSFRPHTACERSTALGRAPSCAAGSFGRRKPVAAGLTRGRGV